MAFFDSDSEAYENLSEAYVSWVSNEYDLDPSGIDLEGDDWYAENFQEFLDILYNYDEFDSYNEWFDAMAELGFDAEWWEFYHDS